MSISSAVETTACVTLVIPPIFGHTLVSIIALQVLKIALLISILLITALLVPILLITIAISAISLFPTIPVVVRVNVVPLLQTKLAKRVPFVVEPFIVTLIFFRATIALTSTFLLNLAIMGLNFESCVYRLQKLVRRYRLLQ